MATTGSRTSSGRRPRTRATLSRTSWAAASTSAVERELERDVAVALLARAGERPEPLDGAQLFLEDVGDRRLDDLRVRARQLGRHRDDRRIDVRDTRGPTSRVYPMTPNRTRAALTMLANTGRRMEMSEIFMRNQLAGVSRYYGA